MTAQLYHYIQRMCSVTIKTAEAGDPLLPVLTALKVVLLQLQLHGQKMQDSEPTATSAATRLKEAVRKVELLHKASNAFLSVKKGREAADKDGDGKGVVGPVNVKGAIGPATNVEGGDTPGGEEIEIVGDMIKERLREKSQQVTDRIQGTGGRVQVFQHRCEDGGTDVNSSSKSHAPTVVGFVGRAGEDADDGAGLVVGVDAAAQKTEAAGVCQGCQRRETGDGQSEKLDCILLSLARLECSLNEMKLQQTHLAEEQQHIKAHIYSPKRPPHSPASPQASPPIFPPPHQCLSSQDIIEETLSHGGVVRADFVMANQIAGGEKQEGMAISIGREHSQLASQQLQESAGMFEPGLRSSSALRRSCSHLTPSRRHARCGYSIFQH